jgi:ABC-2 type transport system permease protein
LNRPATYIYFFIWLLLAFLGIACSSFLQVGGPLGKVEVNASITLFNYAAIFSIIPGIFISSAVMGVPILRDFEHKMESLIFTTNITKSSYLLGRFIGSYYAHTHEYRVYMGLMAGLPHALDRQQ